MTLLWIALGFVFFCAFIFWRLLATAARWGREWQELQQFGRETTGTVVKKITNRNRQGGGHSRLIKYEYVDHMGARHGRKVMAMDEGWAIPEGGPIEIVYSERHPDISAPKYLLGVMATQVAPGAPTTDRPNPAD